MSYLQTLSQANRIARPSASGGVNNDKPDVTKAVAAAVTGPQPTAVSSSVAIPGSERNAKGSSGLSMHIDKIIERSGASAAAKVGVVADSEVGTSQRSGLSRAVDARIKNMRQS